MNILNKNQITQFINLENIELRTKLEVILSPYLDLRRCSQLIIPSEFTDSIELGKQIDDKVLPQILKLQQIRDPKIKRLGIQAIHKVLEKNFEEIVEGSDSYKIHAKWTDIFKLKSFQANVRPTVHEIYYFKNRDTRTDVIKVIKDRAKIREKSLNDLEARKNNIKYAFPEEFNGKWLKKVGSLLGYPECCVKHYSIGRENGINVEARASQQLLESLKEGEVDTHVYYIGNFFPHSPSCPKAIELGYKWEEKIGEFNEELGKLYSQTLIRNAELILRQHELVSLYLSRFNAKIEGPSKPKN
jgi:hypothetical protein